MSRTLSGRIDNHGQPVSGCPVVVMTRRSTEIIPGSTPPVRGRWVIGSTTSAADGTWSLTTDYTGPLMAVAWSQTDTTLQPVVLEPIMG